MPTHAASPPAVLWFRRDLRLADNPALLAAAEGGRAVLPVFILEEDGPARPLGAATRWWLDKSLQALSDALEAIGSRLVLRRGEAAAVMIALVEETGATMAAWGRAWEPGVDARDEALAKALRARGVEVAVGGGKLLTDPTTILTKTGHPFSVFSPFWRAAQASLPQGRPEPAPGRLAPPARWPASDRLADWGLHPTKPDWSGGFSWEPGEASALKRLEEFTRRKLADYPSARDRPAADGSSGLSPHLAWGEISGRQLYAAVQARSGDVAAQPAAEKFMTEVGWRDFDYGLLAQDPELDRTPFKEGLSRLRWRRSAADLEAWRRGRTGYPIVDAGMRQLWSLGWMHNRMRLLTSSFLVKHLLIDWREGERWFWDCLVDADPANNPANWQWIAGTGADAQPFFRIFAPVSQAERFDPDGDYVRRWVPELALADRRWIHSPWTASAAELAKAGVELGIDYPKPIVVHEAARARALAALKAAREAGPQARAAAAAAS